MVGGLFDSSRDHLPSDSLKEKAARLEQLYRQLYAQARTTYSALPELPLDLHVDPKARSTHRSFAFFQSEPADRTKTNCLVSLSPELALDDARAEAVTAHEVGHYVDYFFSGPEGRAYIEERIGGPLPKSKERLADRIAESFLRKALYYDASTVQTTDPEKGKYRPRPKGLG